MVLTVLSSSWPV